MQPHENPVLLCSEAYQLFSPWWIGFSILNDTTDAIVLEIYKMYFLKNSPEDLNSSDHS